MGMGSMENKGLGLVFAYGVVVDTSFSLLFGACNSLSTASTSATLLARATADVKLSRTHTQAARPDRHAASLRCDAPLGLVRFWFSPPRCL